MWKVTNMKSLEIKAENRRALKKFIPIMAVSMIIGGVCGYLFTMHALSGLASILKTAGREFGMRTAPWLMLAVAVAVPAVSLTLYGRSKKQLTTWDGEDEAISDAIEKRLSLVIWFSSASLILSEFLIAAAYSNGFAIFDERRSTVLFFVSIACFLATLAEVLIVQQKCVDLVKEMNPEKIASVYDTRFQKKWLDSCDEAERLLIGKCAYQAYLATNTVCPILSSVLAVCALLFDIGFLPSLSVCVIWMINLSVYCKESMQYSKVGNKIS